jgi:hypothetical protein
MAMTGRLRLAPPQLGEQIDQVPAWSGGTFIL